MSLSQRYKILVLIKSLGLGGAERLIIDSLPYLNQSQFDYHFAYLLPWKRLLVPRFKEAGVPIYCLGTRKYGKMTTDAGRPFSLAQDKFFNARDGKLVELQDKPFDLAQDKRAAGGGGWAALGVVPTALRRLVEMQQWERFDLIHADLPLAGILARLTGRRYGLPVIYTEHNLQERYHPLTRWANGVTYGWNKRVLAVSEEVAASIGHYGLDRKTQVVTMLNGVPVEQVRAEASHQSGLQAELEIPANHLVVGTVAVFRRQKRLEDWLEVAARVAVERKDVTFLMVGHGPEEEVIKAKIQALGLAERVRLPGFRPDGRRVMGLMDVYLMSSEHEGLPIALLEAMALGKPVVATAVGGIPELVKDGKEGYLTSVSDIGGLTHYTLRLLEETNVARQMGQRGAAKIEAEFHIKHRVCFIENLYLEVLGERRRKIEDEGLSVLN